MPPFSSTPVSCHYPDTPIDPAGGWTRPPGVSKNIQKGLGRMKADVRRESRQGYWLELPTIGVTSLPETSD